MTRKALLVITSAAAIGGLVAVALELGGDPATGPAPMAQATAPPAPPPAAEAAFTTRTVRTLETKAGAHTFVERRYAPEYPLTRLAAAPDATWLSSPEATLASLFAAMQAGDWDWAMSLFDAGSEPWRASITPERARYLDAWGRLYRGHDFVLTHRHDIPGYAIIYARRTDRPVGAPDDLYPYALRADATGRWWLTHDIDEHPVKNLSYFEHRNDDARRQHATR